MQGLVDDCRIKMTKKLQWLDDELSRIRTGRASVTLLDKVFVKYYGTNTQLNQVASITVPDAKSLVVSPFEKKILPDIEKAIMAANLGLQPNNDGNILRIPVPPLTEDRRREIVKSIKKIGEEAKVAVRLVRRDTNDLIKKDAKELGEDLSKKMQKDVQKETDNCIASIAQRLAKKEQEVLNV